MIATQDSFTKELFSSLHLEWNNYAEVRDLLTKVIFEEETLEMLFEDIIFTLGRFFESVNKYDVESYYEITKNNYELKINLDINSEQKITTIFRIQFYKDKLMFYDNVGSVCEFYSLEDLQMFMVHWFEHFYKRYVV